MRIQDITIALSDATSSKILDMLDRNGICLIRKYIGSDDLLKLDSDFQSIFNYESGTVNISNHPRNLDGMVARLKLDTSKDKVLGVYQVFKSQLMENVSKEYFGGNGINLNEDVFFTKEFESSDDILPWHFDRQQSLKFYMNLVDVDESNEAFEYDVGSHREELFRANCYILKGLPLGDIPNDIPFVEVRCPLRIAADAGDLVIFDPDGFHKAGTIQPGKCRKVIRGYTHPKPNHTYKAKPLDCYWWVQSCFNISKLSSNKAGRILPEKRLTSSVLTRLYK
ncbi:hypothetical protein ACFVYJ_06575 [Pontibacter sp. JAM-7]|uniref:hypothetical protein n=1 Tax=Pontibacter sp. JAM-7 TaxID=3366581 RepID=UPI003AF6CAAD